MRKHVTITRKWHSPEIHITVSNEEISLQLDIEDFREALKAEVGPVSLVFRKSTFEKMVDAAFERIIHGVKEESAKVMA